MRAFRFPVYYGWVIVATVVLCDFVQSQETFPILAIMLKPVTEEFGWSRTAFTTPVAVGTVIGGVFGPFLGPRVDGWGPRWVTAGSFLALGALLCLMAWMQELWQYNVLQIAARAIIHGIIGLTLVVVVPKWFIARQLHCPSPGEIGTMLLLGGAPKSPAKGCRPLHSCSEDFWPLISE
ncbi:MAG: hypothetical protein EXR51_00725 [Dehalococcoidia bacterium]|nr:hypothetical protein [Dehalococcoidia bacterium]